MDVERTMTREVVTCRPEDSLERAARRLHRHDLGGLPVVDQAGRLEGMLTDRDICMAALQRGRALREIAVREAMTRDVVSLSPSQSLLFAAELMGQFQVRRLPVLDGGGRVLGILSLVDLARRAGCGEMRDGEDVGLDDVTTALAQVGAPPAAPPLPLPAPTSTLRRRPARPSRRGQEIPSIRRSSW